MTRVLSDRSKERRTKRPEPSAGQSQTRAHLGMFLRAAALANVGLIAAAVACAVLHGTLGAANALVAGAVTLVFFAGGQGVQLLAGQVGGPLGLGIVVMSFAVRVGLLGLALALAMRHEQVEPYVDAVGLISGTLATVAGWIGGLIWGEVTSRIPYVMPDASTPTPPNDPVRTDSGDKV